MTQKSIKEEWRKTNFDDAWAEDVSNEIADWFLSKFSTLLQTIESEIEGEKRKAYDYEHIFPNELGILNENGEYEKTISKGQKITMTQLLEDEDIVFNKALDSAKAIISKYKEI